MSITKEVQDHVRTIQPTGDRVLVQVSDQIRKVGSVWLPDGGKSLDVIVSQVLALGPDVKARRWELAPGDYVLHVRVVGVGYDGTLGLLGRDSQKVGAKYRFLKEGEILAVVSPDSVGNLTGSASYDEGRTGMRDTRDL